MSLNAPGADKHCEYQAIERFHGNDQESLLAGVTA